MPKPIANSAVAIIEFTMVRHWFLSLAAILAFTLWASILDAAPEIGKTTGAGFGFKHPFVTFALFPFILVYGAFCAIADALGIGGSAKARTAVNRWATAVCRIYAKNVKLAWKVFWAVLLLLTIIGGAVAILAPKGTPRADGGGPESEKFYRFMNAVTAPLQWITNTIRFGLAILAIVFLATLYFTYQVFAFSPVVPLATAVIIVLVYAAWLWRITRRIVAEEFGDQVTISHALTALIPAQLTTWFLFMVFFFSTQTGWHWLIAQIPE